MAWVKFLFEINSFEYIFHFTFKDNDSRTYFYIYKEIIGTLNYVYESDNVFTEKKTDKVLTSGIWAHVAFTIKENELSLFIDSNKVSSADVPSTHHHQLESVQVGIGGNPWAGNCNNIIEDELKIFNRALTDEEIAHEKNIAQPFEIEEI